MISTHNSPEYLKRVLQSYVNQTVVPDEIVIGDDGSGERTAEVIREFQQKADFAIKHIWQEHKGMRIARLRNEALKAASMDYLIITDGDCIPEKRFIEDHIRVMEPGYFIQGKRMLVSQKVSPNFNLNGHATLFKLAISGDLSNIHHLIRIPGFSMRYTKYINNIKTCNFAVYRKDFLAVNGFNEDFIGWRRSDTELAVRLYKYGLKRKDIPFSAIVYHLWHSPGSSEHVKRNDEILNRSIKSSDYFCKNGISKKEIEPEK